MVAIQDWDSTDGSLPGEDAFEVLVLDMQTAFANKTLGRVGRRLNYEVPGMSSLFRTSGRHATNINEAPYKDQLLKIDKRWGDIGTWRLIQRESGVLTGSYFLASVDLRLDDRGEIAWQSEERQIYLTLFFRTLWMSAVITLLCLVLGFPIAPVGDFAAAHQQSVDDSRAVAVLDFVAGAHDILDRLVADFRSLERPARLLEHRAARGPAANDAQ